ncbi:Uncharacterized protein GBIM_20266 [Gryllus bimaculatus]|nr:Uncharacterized protein GBIM_20266 [Gryllus bimaculatus]
MQRSLSSSPWRAVAAALVLLAALGAATAAEAEAGNAVDGEDGGGGREPKAASLGALGRSVLTQLARQLVLSLNLTNLLILLVLKALLFGAGMFSFGLLNHKGGVHATGRSADGGDGGAAPSYLPTLTESELLLALSFLAGDAAASKAGAGAGAGAAYTCLHRVACEKPADARQYAGAANILLKGARMLHSFMVQDKTQVFLHNGGAVQPQVREDRRRSAEGRGLRSEWWRMRRTIPVRQELMTLSPPLLASASLGSLRQIPLTLFEPRVRKEMMPDWPFLLLKLLMLADYADDF